MLKEEIAESATHEPVAPARGPRTWRTWQLLGGALVALIVGVAIGGSSGKDDNEVRAAKPPREAPVATTAPSPELPATEVERTSATAASIPTTTAAKPRAVGTRSNPLPAGQTAILGGKAGDEWLIKVVGFAPDATTTVAQENQFNDPPAPGRQFAMVRLEATYVGSDEPQALMGAVTFQMLDNANVTYDTDDDCGVIPDELDSWGDVYNGGVITGNECWSVTSEHIDSLLLVIEPSFSWDSKPYFMSVR